MRRETSLLLFFAFATMATIALAQVTSAPQAVTPTPGQPGWRADTFQGQCPLSVEMVKQHCKVSGANELVAPAGGSCHVQMKFGTMASPFLSMTMWQWHPGLKEEISNAPMQQAKNMELLGMPVKPLPVWNESGLGEEAFLMHPLDPSVKREELNEQGFTLYVKKQNVLYGFSSTPFGEAGCSVPQVKAIAQGIVSRK